MILARPVLALIEVSINRALAEDPDTRARFDKMNGKCVCIHLQGLDVQFYLLMAIDGIQVAGDISGEPDAIIRGWPFSMLHTAMTGDRQRLFEGDVVIEGDMEFGQQFQRALNQLSIDWEDVLSRFVGDVAAHKIGEFAKQTFSWLQSSTRAVSRDAAEYLQEESRDLPHRLEVEPFLQDVDTVRADIERIEQRVLRLERRLEEKVV